ncbi:MAG TPA: phosphoribosylaminoimidazolesuccinocarboxamide synthase [Thermoplasmatales archaeon]|nr:phosphoribosylaminoimidazolesuccinocarboxamide synthase [Thermoplasmatales archaeon]
MQEVVTETNLPLNIVKRGKVRDLYDIDEYLLMVATDRISAFDRVLPDPIPGKGVCLTQLSVFWFNYFKNLIPNHLVTASVDEYPSTLQPYRDILYGRSMLVKKTKVYPVECIVRGYISGSAWSSYKKNGTVCGIKLPVGLKESQQLDEPIFTPSTKAESGHDINISFKELVELVGRETAEQLQEYSLKIYEEASKYARSRGIIIADTKFEFGETKEEELIVVDELLTPDSSRFWPADEYTPGKPQPSFDKQFVRDYLREIGWSGDSDPPRLPREVVEGTQQRYREAYERLTGKNLSELL